MKEKAMTVEQLRAIAKELGVKPSNLRKSELIKSIQRAEGNFDCFGTAEDYCDQTSCLFLHECLSS
jgi:hypothetical protein